jgi:hypothetical protein
VDVQLADAEMVGIGKRTVARQPPATGDERRDDNQFR